MELCLSCHASHQSNGCCLCACHSICLYVYVCPSVCLSVLTQLTFFLPDYPHSLSYRHHFLSNFRCSFLLFSVFLCLSRSFGMLCLSVCLCLMKFFLFLWIVFLPLFLVLGSLFSFNSLSLCVFAYRKFNSNESASGCCSRWHHMYSMDDDNFFS